MGAQICVRFGCDRLSWISTMNPSVNVALKRCAFVVFHEFVRRSNINRWAHACTRHLDCIALVRDARGRPQASHPHICSRRFITHDRAARRIPYWDAKQ
jgi:hypothetical protein